MMQWEYKAESVWFDDADKLEAWLNALGKDGWELVWFDDPASDRPAHCIFKRPVLRVSVGGITVEGESGEIYHHRHADPTLTALGTLEQAMREQKRGAYKAKPGARV